MQKLLMSSLIVLLVSCGAAETNARIAQVTQAVQPVLDSAIRACQIGRVEIERSGGDPAELVAVCEDMLVAARAIRAAQDLAEAIAHE